MKPLNFNSKMVMRFILAASVAITLAINSPSVFAASVVAELTQATNKLFAGRDYIVGFPAMKTRNGLRQDYLGVDMNGAPRMGYQPKLPLLREAIAHAVTARKEPDIALSAGQNERAQLVAWESLEALLQGQLITGNGNLLKGLRVAFPTAMGARQQRIIALKPMLIPTCGTQSGGGAQLTPALSSERR